MGVPGIHGQHQCMGISVMKLILTVLGTIALTVGTFLLYAGFVIGVFAGITWAVLSILRAMGVL